MRRFVVGLAIGLASFAPAMVRGDDEQIAQKIVEKLQERKESGQMRGFNIDLQVDQGTVWLKGNVASVEQQKMALDLARRVQGVEKVVNELKVDAPAQPKAASSARPSLFRDVLAKAMPGSSDESPTPAARPESRPMAKQVSTAPSPTAARGDDQLVKEIMTRLSAYKQAGQLKGFQIDVQADGGVVWVSGRVANSQQHALIIDTIRRTGGVTQVVNDLQIMGGTSRAEGTGVATPVNHEAPAGQPMAVAPQAAGSYTAIPVQLVPAPQPFIPGGQVAPVQQGARVAQRPLAFAASQGGVAPVATMQPQAAPQMPVPAHMPGGNVGIAPARFDHPNLPGYAWPSYAPYPNYAAVTYPKQYSPAAWPYIGPFYPYPQVPLGWRKVTLEWDDGWWNLDFKSK